MGRIIDKSKYRKRIIDDTIKKYLENIKDLYGDNVCCKIKNGGSISHPMDIVYNIEINKFNYRETVQFIVQDIRLK